MKIIYFSIGCIYAGKTKQLDLCIYPAEILKSKISPLFSGFYHKLGWHADT